jgi:hypothetical protein
MRQYAGLWKVLLNGLACHMVVSVFLLRSSFNIHAKSEKFRPPRDIFGIEIHLLKVKVLYFTLLIYSVYPSSFEYNKLCYCSETRQMSSSSICLPREPSSSWGRKHQSSSCCLSEWLSVLRHRQVLLWPMSPALHLQTCWMKMAFPNI